MQVMRVVVLCAALVIGVSPVFAEGGEHGLEQLLIESASTPAQHHALAQHFSAKAAAARREAERHRSIAKTYGGTKLVVAEAQRKHCNDLAASYDTQATLYDAMATAHEAEAKK
jgi:hypothetical protein